MENEIIKIIKQERRVSIISRGFQRLSLLKIDTNSERNTLIFNNVPDVIKKFSIDDVDLKHW